MQDYYKDKKFNSSISAKNVRFDESNEHAPPVQSHGLPPR